MDEADNNIGGREAGNNTQWETPPLTSVFFSFLVNYGLAVLATVTRLRDSALAVGVMCGHTVANLWVAMPPVPSFCSSVYFLR